MGRLLQKRRHNLRWDEGWRATVGHRGKRVRPRIAPATGRHRLQTCATGMDTGCEPAQQRMLVAEIPYEERTQVTNLRYQEMHGCGAHHERSL